MAELPSVQSTAFAMNEWILMDFSMFFVVPCCWGISVGPAAMQIEAHHAGPPTNRRSFEHWHPKQLVSSWSVPVYARLAGRQPQPCERSSSIRHIMTNLNQNNKSKS